MINRRDRNPPAHTLLHRVAVLRSPPRMLRPVITVPAALTLAIALLVVTATPAEAFDPFDTQATIRTGACTPRQPAGALRLAEVVDLALCNNPQTREAWSQRRVQAGLVGVARAPLPARDQWQCRQQPKPPVSRSAGNQADAEQRFAGDLLAALRFWRT